MKSNYVNKLPLWKIARKKFGSFDKGRIKYAQSANLAEMGKKAAVINGDGTGPELVDAMIHVLEACNTQIELIRCEAGSEQWKKKWWSHIHS